MKYLQKLPLILILIGLTTTSCRDEIKETEASNTSVKEAYPMLTNKRLFWVTRSKILIPLRICSKPIKTS